MSAIGNSFPHSAADIVYYLKTKYVNMAKMKKLDIHTK